MKHWTVPEVTIVRQQYPVAGVEACLALLPHRTKGSIYQQAAKLGLGFRASKAGNPRKRWQTDLFTDDAIRAVYMATPKKNDVLELARRIGRPRWWVSKRAVQLGLKVPRFKEAAWTEDELDLLEKHAHKDVRTIARTFRAHGYTRSETSIHVKRKRLALGVRELRQQAGLYSAAQVASLMGVDGKTLTRWINLGWMKTAGRRGTARVVEQGGDAHEINADQIRQFIVEHPERVDLRKVDRLWFIELLGRTAA